MSEPEVVWSGTFLDMRRRGGWEYAARPGGQDVVAVLALDYGEVLLVEQHRPPIGGRCLELPAGLAGDRGAETLEATAMRELEEETGWRPGRLEVIGEFCSSSGLTSERVTLFRATELTRAGVGGGVEGEDIVVHRVALAGLRAFVEARRTAGVAVDVKLLVMLGDALSG